MVLHPDTPAGLDEGALDDLVRRRLWFADGVLLPGGGDLAAHWSGQDSHASQYDIDEEQDAFDLSVARVAIAEQLPLLAICRGNQVVNVARGGDLVQDLGESLGADHQHRVHMIELTEDSPLRDVVTGDQLLVSCYHHQGIKRLGRGLSASAYADDGTIEAVALANYPGWFLGVQWHPEDSADRDPSQAGIFKALVLAASEPLAAQAAV